MGNGAASLVRPDSYLPPAEVGPSLQHSGKLSAHSQSTSSRSTSTSGSDHFRITADLVAVCDSSWKLITRSKSIAVSPEDPNKIAGFGQFCHVFFDCMTALDEDNDIVEKFEPRSSSALISREALLYRVVKYIVSVPGDSFKVKAKLRALGRAHAYRGIGQKQFAVFQTSMVQALAIQLKSAATNEVMRAWTYLLEFVVGQLTFDKVVLVKHHTIDAPLDLSPSEEVAANLISPGDSDKKFETAKSSDQYLGSDLALPLALEGFSTFARLNSFGSTTDQSSRDASFNFVADAASANPDIVQANYMAPIPENAKDSSGSASSRSSDSSGRSRVANASSNDEDSVSAVAGASEVSFSVNEPVDSTNAVAADVAATIQSVLKSSNKTRGSNKVEFSPGVESSSIGRYEKESQ